MVNLSAKLDEEAHSDLVYIVFKSLPIFLYLSIVTLNFNLWPSKSLELILAPWFLCLPSLIKKNTTV